ncbi:DUF6695 family protein [Winogradskyella endarachnes]|uniref:Uncharacterized protein n=1 Tax=Winogradskyella endarachnes TaxID=2681965 RepID=A0A6L6U6W7_9FLAO|nr:DUF6695 family protein [Winogradskyella endarachnes]MUU77918.1 hypothetical protein [Winogradskyella endarachnes]
MLKNDAFIISLAYPDTIVRISDEKLVSYLKYFNIGCANYVRAGHAALVLIDKSTGCIEYFDFGRYTTPQGYGRVRGKLTDNELDFPLKANIDNEKIINLNEILSFLATHPKLTHGDGKLVASVCAAIDYNRAKNYIMQLQNKIFVRYGAFYKNGSNCARFVTDTIINSVNNDSIKKKLIKSKRFTPSTVGNVEIADTQNKVYEVSDLGNISEFKSTSKSENRRCFLDKLNNFEPNFIGNLQPKHVSSAAKHSQWLEGIGAGAWFELYNLKLEKEFRCKRISPYGTIDCDSVYEVDSEGFNINKKYKFLHPSHCLFFTVEQSGKQFRFNFLRDY